MNLLSLLLPHITRLQFVKHWLLTEDPMKNVHISHALTACMTCPGLLSDYWSSHHMASARLHLAISYLLSCRWKRVDNGEAPCKQL